MFSLLPSELICYICQYLFSADLKNLLVAFRRTRLAPLMMYQYSLVYHDEIDAVHRLCEDVHGCSGGPRQEIILQNKRIRLSEVIQTNNWISNYWNKLIVDRFTKFTDVKRLTPKEQQILRDLKIIN